MLPLGVLFVALVRLVQQHVPLAAVIVVAEVNDALFLRVAQVVGAIGEDGQLLAAQQRRMLAFRFGIFAQLAQAQQGCGPTGVEVAHVVAQLAEQILAVGQHQHVAARDQVVPHQPPERLQQLDDDQRLAAAGRHPEAHAVDQLDVGQLPLAVGYGRQGVVGLQQSDVVALLAHVQRRGQGDGVVPIAPEEAGFAALRPSSSSPS